MKSMRKMSLGWLAVCAAACGAGEIDALGAAKATAKKAGDWLYTQANADGTFGTARESANPGVVGLVLHALATSSEKPTKEQAAILSKAAEYLAGKQMENGAIALPRAGLENYFTSVSILGLKALNDPKYNEVLEKAKKYVLTCQLDEDDGYNSSEHNRAYGGFGYGSSKKPDLSNTSFSLDALKAMGVKEDSPAFKNALLFVRRCQDNLETNDVAEMKAGDNTGGFVYLPGEGEFGKVKSRSGQETPAPYGNMTYAGVKSLIYCGLKQDSPELQAAWKWIKNNYSVKANPGGKGTQGYYYYVVAFAKAFTAAGTKELTLPDGKKVHWAKDLAAQLATLQKPNGSFANDDKRWWETDPILATSYALSALNLCVAAVK